METSPVRTDLALEARESASGELPGVAEERRELRGFHVTRLRVLDERGEEALCKPRGEYVTVELDRLLRREENAFSDCAELLGEVLRSLLGALPKGGCVLAVGLGNEYITPDAIGPWAMDSVLVTRHLAQLPEFRHFRPVAALRASRR